MLSLRKVRNIVKSSTKYSTYLYTSTTSPAPCSRFPLRHQAATRADCRNSRLGRWHFSHNSFTNSGNMYQSSWITVNSGAIHIPNRHTCSGRRKELPVVNNNVFPIKQKSQTRTPSLCSLYCTLGLSFVMGYNLLPLCFG